MRRLAIPACALLFATLGFAQKLAPYRYSEDFRSGQAAGWTSYPPVQDVAYDPSLRPVEGAVMRVVRPTRAGPLDIGFIRRMSFVVSPAFRISLEASLDPPASPVDLEIGLALRSGPLLLGRAKTGAVRLSAADFAGKSGGEVEAVYVIARLANASAAIEYSLRLSAVSIDAERPPRTEVAEPVLIESRGWEKRVASRVYSLGQELEVKPAKGVRLVSPDGVGRTAGRFTEKDRPGLWQVELPDGSDFTLLLTGKKPGAHPRMADLDELRRRAAHPDFAEAWKRIRERAARSRVEAVAPPYAGSNILRLYRGHLLPALMSYFGVLGRTADRVLTNALVGAVESNQEAIDAAQVALLAAAGWPTWTPPWFTATGMHTYYEAGIFARSLALGYDLLHSEMQPDIQRRVRRALRELSIQPTFREHFLDARMPFATSNWIGNSISGAVVALAVTEGEDPEQDLDGVLTGLVARLRAHVDDTILPDGSSGEPLGYQDFDLEGVGWTLAALERVYGVDLRAGTALDRSHLYAVYNAVGKDQFADMGDGDLHSARGFAWFASRSQDARLRSLYRTLSREPVGELLLGPPAGGGTEEALPPSRIFDVKGAAVFRSGWEPEATVLAYRAGPNFNHNHADAGTFLLSAGGKLLLSEAGVSHYYNDPHYGSHFIQAVGHNVMLVDGNPESQRLPDYLPVRALDRRPRWETALVSETADLLRTDLQPVYKAPLQSYQRALLFVRPSYLVLCDRVRAGEEHTYSWLFHPPAALDTKLRREAASFSVERPGISLWARMASTGTLELGEHDFPVPLRELESLATREIPERRYVEVTGGRASSGALITLLHPLQAGQQPPGVEELRSASGLGFKIGAADWVVFRLGTDRARVADMETDADSVFLRASAETVERLVADACSSLSRRGRELLSSPTPVTVAAVWSATGVQGKVRSSRPVTFRLAAFGGSTPNLEVSAPAGESSFSLSYR